MSQLMKDHSRRVRLRPLPMLLPERDIVRTVNQEIVDRRWVVRGRNIKRRNLGLPPVA